MIERDREKDGGREIEKDRGRERQIDREKDGERERERERGREREKKRERGNRYAPTGMPSIHSAVSTRADVVLQSTHGTYAAGSPPRPIKCSCFAARSPLRPSRVKSTSRLRLS